MGALKAWHIIVLILAFILLFGWKNLPNAARSLGQSMRVFKSEVDQMKDDNETRKGPGATAADDRALTDGEVRDDIRDERGRDIVRDERRLDDGRDDAPRV